MPYVSMRSVSVLAAGALLAFAASAASAERSAMAADLHRIELEWAKITYQLSDADTQEEKLQTLASEAKDVAEHYPGRADPIIWEGIIASAEAKYAGPFSALGYAKQARDFFETAGRIDFKAIDGAVPTSLGALYYMVPGFPLGFGDDDKAREYLVQGVTISPNGLDSNYFYGDFLYRQGEYDKAEAVLKHALEAPADPTRPVWDSGRRGDIRALLVKLDQQIVSGR